MNAYSDYRLEIQEQLNALETNLLRDEKLQTALEDEIASQKQETHWSKEGLLEIREEYGEEEESKEGNDNESDVDDDFETKLRKNQMKINKIAHPELLVELETKIGRPEPLAKSPADIRKMMEQVAKEEEKRLASHELPLKSILKKTEQQPAILGKIIERNPVMQAPLP